MPNNKNTKGRKMNKLTRRTFVTGSAALLCAPAIRAEAQSAWPAKSIRIVVPYPAGGQTDGIARAFGDYLARQVGKPVIIENKAGAGGVIGVSDAKRADPDGTTILCTISSSLIQNRVTVKDLPYDPEKDFIYLTMVSGAGGPVVAAKKTGAKTLREFIDYANKVGSLNWGSYGVGSTPHVLIETIAKQYGIKFQVIQYRGEAPMWNDIAGQTLDGAAGSYAAAAPVIQAGTGNLIGVVGTPATVSGYAYDDRARRRRRLLRPRAFTTFAVPAGTPKNIVERISPLLIQAGSDPKSSADAEQFYTLVAGRFRNDESDFQARQRSDAPHPARSRRQAIGVNASSGGRPPRTTRRQAAN